MRFDGHPVPAGWARFETKRTIARSAPPTPARGDRLCCARAAHGGAHGARRTRRPARGWAAGGAVEARGGAKGERKTDGADSAAAAAMPADAAARRAPPSKIRPPAASVKPPAGAAGEAGADSGDAGHGFDGTSAAAVPTAMPLRRGRAYAPPPALPLPLAGHCQEPPSSLTRHPHTPATAISTAVSRPASARGGDRADASREQHVRVVVRVRPHTAAQDAPRCVRVCENGTITAVTPPTSSNTSNTAFAFDAVLGEAATQADTYDVVAGDLVKHVCKGYNACVLAYGQTGSGKTHTILGADGDVQGLGVGPRALHALFRRLEDEERVASLKVSFAEVYNEAIGDLLAETDPLDRSAGATGPGGAFSPGASGGLTSSGGGLPLREGKVGAYVEGLTWVPVTSYGEALEVLEQGAVERRVSATEMNEQSSRSHAVFTLELNQKATTDSPALSSRLRIVDLAGSERQRTAGTRGESLKETCGINLSLSCLGNVIRGLAQHAQQPQLPQPHIHYRDSKLTFLLKDSLGGNAYTAVCATVSSAMENAAETISTLQFASRCKLVRTRAVVNEDIEDVEALKAEIARLRRQLSDRQIPASNPLEPTRVSDATPSMDGEAAVREGPEDVQGEGALSESADQSPSAPTEGEASLVEASLSAALAGALRRERGLERHMAALGDKIGALEAEQDDQSGDAGPEQDSLKQQLLRLRAENARLSQLLEPAAAEEISALRADVRVLRDEVLVALATRDERGVEASLGEESSTSRVDLVEVSKMSTQLETFRGRVQELEEEIARAGEREEEARLTAMDTVAAELARESEAARAARTRAEVAERRLAAREEELAAAAAAERREQRAMDARTAPTAGADESCRGAKSEATAEACPPSVVGAVGTATADGAGGAGAPTPGLNSLDDSLDESICMLAATVGPAGVAEAMSDVIEALRAELAEERHRADDAQARCSAAERRADELEAVLHDSEVLRQAKEARSPGWAW